MFYFFVAFGNDAMHIKQVVLDPLIYLFTVILIVKVTSMRRISLSSRV